MKTILILLVLFLAGCSASKESTPKISTITLYTKEGEIIQVWTTSENIYRSGGGYYWKGSEGEEIKIKGEIITIVTKEKRHETNANRS